MKSLRSARSAPAAFRRKTAILSSCFGLTGIVSKSKCGMLLATLLGLAAVAAEEKALPKRDVVQVPAIGQGLCVANVFQSNMVLQRDQPLKIWGWADPGEDVTVSFAGRQAAAQAAADRSWEVTLKPVSTRNTPQVMTVKGGSTNLTLENILVGDVWVLGGQSNMEFPISKVDEGELEIVSANFPQIRLLTMPLGKGFRSVRSFERLHEWSDWFGTHFRKGDWDVCSPETVNEFSAIGYVFGRRVFMATQVPIGLIDASVGGTTVETWTPEDVLRKIEGRETRDLLRAWDDRITAFNPQADLEQRVAHYHKNLEKMQAKGEPPPTDLRPGPASDMNRPGFCYAGVIRPLAGLTIKGAVFHQGFNNCFHGSAGARMYYQVFGKMITAWRGTFNDPQMPFCILSLCTADAPQTREHFLKPMFDAGPYIREAQYRTFRDFWDAGDKHIGFASSFDLRKSWYHPQIKVPLGERAAKWALATQYGVFPGSEVEEMWLPPSIKEVRIVDHTLRLTLSTAVTMKDDSEDRMNGFAIAGQDRRFFPAEVRWFTDGSKDERHILVLSSPFVPAPMHYRYAWARNPLGNITNSRQVPLAAQRSDDWLMEETPVKFPVPPGMGAEEVARFLRGQILKELELDDTERRIKEAEATVSTLKEQFTRDKQAWEEKKAASPGPR